MNEKGKMNSIKERKKRGGKKEKKESKIEREK